VSVLAADVERFLLDHVDSVAQLDALVLLHGRAPAELRVEAVARELGVDTAWAIRELTALADAGALGRRDHSPPAFRYAPASDALRATVDGVVRAYRERPVTVVEILMTKPSRHIRSFADAFRLRKE
jgi:hypothetical protein